MKMEFTCKANNYEPFGEWEIAISAVKKKKKKRKKKTQWHMILEKINHSMIKVKQWPGGCVTRYFLRTKASYIMRARLGSGKKTTDPCHEETGFLPRRKQRRRSASQ